MGSSLWFALGSTLVLVVLHLSAPHIRRLPFVPEQATASFAGGLAVSYVFLHLLPEIARGSQHVTRVLGDQFEPSPLLELAIFAVALLGFVIFHALERLARRSRRARGSAGVPDPAQGERPAPEQRRVFAVHVGLYAIYNGVIAYTLPTNWRASPSFAVLFTLAIGLHFVLNDRSLEDHYGSQFDRRPPRLALAAALALGWIVASVLAPTSTMVVSVLTAFVAGGVLLNVFRDEIPSSRRSSFGWFLTGLVIYSFLLAAVTMAEGATAETGGEAGTHPVPGTSTAMAPLLPWDEPATMGSAVMEPAGRLRLSR